jgi:hypothetical protein
LSLFLVFCSRMMSTPSCIGPGSPCPCMSRCPGNPRHLSVDSIRASALLGPTSVPPCVWRGHRSHGPSARAPQQDGGLLRMGRRCHGGAGTAAPRWSRPPQTKPSGAKPPLHRPMKKPVGREPVTAHWREGFLFISPLLRTYSRSSTPLLGSGGGISPAWRTPGLGAAVSYYLAYGHLNSVTPPQA